MVQFDISAPRARFPKGGMLEPLDGSWTRIDGGLWASPNPHNTGGSGGTGGTGGTGGGVTTQQLDPGLRNYRLYTLTDPTSAVFAEILVAKTSYSSGGVTFEGGNEYWSMLAPTPGGSALSIAMEELDWPADGSAVPGFPAAGALETFRMPVAVTWRQSRADPSNMHVSTSGSQIVCIQWNLTYSGSWGGNLTWFQNVNKGSKPSALVLPSGGTFTYNRDALSINGKQDWFSTQVVPL